MPMNVLTSRPREANVTPFCPVIFVLISVTRFFPQPSMVGEDSQITPDDAPKSSVPSPAKSSETSLPSRTCRLKMTPA